MQRAARVRLRRPGPRVPILSLALALVLLLGACTGSGSGDPDAAGAPGASAEDMAAGVAAALSEHTLDGIALTRKADRQAHADLVAPLADQPVEVTVEEVDDDGDTAAVSLQWRWDVRGHAWDYETLAPLRREGDRWRLDWTPAVLESSLHEGDRLGLSTTPAQRGRILGRRGAPLVTDRPVLRYGLDKTQVRPGRAVRSARAIARALDVDPARLAGQARDAGPEAFVEALVLRTEDARTQVPATYADIPGATVVEDTLPLAPTREFAAPVLGRVGPATAEIVESSEGRVRAGDEVGLSGLQQRYDESLAGRAGVEVVAAAGEEARPLFTAQPEPGEDLRTTLDPTLQARAESALRGLGEDGPPAALVAIRPSTGALVAVANGPGNAGLEIAATGRFAPGSTFKVVTALALLRAGVRPDQALPCPTTTEVDGRTFKNYDDYPASQVGRISLTAAIAHSCNTSLIAAGDRLREGDLASAAEALGVGPDADLGFPAYFGQVPAPGSETGKAASLIGQGTVLASPLAMAGVAASVVEGSTVTPVLLPDHEPTRRQAAQPLTTGEATTLRGLMRAVVTQGSASFLADVPGRVGAKTGTAEYGEPDGSGSLPTHAWMIATRRDLAVAVFVESGASGSQTAGPILEDFLS